MELFDLLLAKQLGGGGGGSATINPLSVSANGTYTATGGVDGYSPVTVNVPQPSGTKNIISNGDYDVATYASAHVSVPGITPTGTLSITANGTYNVTNYASADVNVSGGGGDDRFTKYVEGTLSVAEDNEVTRIKDYAFQVTSALETANFPNVLTIGNSAFNTCPSLANISFPNATEVGAYAFTYCSSLASVNFSKVTSIGAGAFSNCKSIVTASFPKVTSIGNNVFRGCNHLVSLYLMGDTVPIIGTSVFSSTPIGGYSASAGQYGNVFVPSSLWATYQTANNWSSIANRIVSV